MLSIFGNKLIWPFQNASYLVLVKDTWHTEWLCEGMECWSPGDLPGGDVRDDETKLQQQVIELQKDNKQVISMKNTH